MFKKSDLFATYPVLEEVSESYNVCRNSEEETDEVQGPEQEVGCVIRLEEWRFGGQVHISVSRLWAEKCGDGF